MVQMEYVRKRKRRRLVALASSIGTVGVSVFVLVAFLGRHIGTFTVALNNDQVQLSLSRKLHSGEKTSFLYVDSLPSFEQYTYNNLPSDEVLDSEETDYLMKEAAHYDIDGKSLKSLSFFKYTFYIMNVGDKPAGYTMNINIVDDHPSTDGTNRSLTDILRVILYENRVTDDGQVTHRKTVFAKAPDVERKDAQGHDVAKEYTSTPVPAATDLNPVPDPAFAEPFKTDPLTGAVDGVGSISTDVIFSGGAYRYTFVCYLEGQDLSDQNKHPPEGASVKLGIQVNGYESKS